MQRISSSLREEIEKFVLELVSQKKTMYVATLSMQPNLLERIKAAQLNDPIVLKYKAKVEVVNSPELVIIEDGALRYGSRLFVLNEEDLNKEILSEVHSTPYLVHPRSTNMYRDLSNYWWISMRIDESKFIERCLTCQQVKAEHQRPSGLFKPLMIL